MLGNGIIGDLFPFTMIRLAAMPWDMALEWVSNSYAKGDDTGFTLYIR